MSVESKEPGLLRFKENIPYDEKILSLVTNTDIDHVRVAIDLFKKLEMIEIRENGDIWIEEVKNLTGSETEDAIRKRKTRSIMGNKKTKSGKCPENVTESKSIEYRDKSKSKSKSKSKNKRERKPQTEQELINYFYEYSTLKKIDLNQECEAEKFRAWYDSKGWKDIKDWKGRVRTWVLRCGDNKVIDRIGRFYEK